MTLKKLSPKHTVIAMLLAMVLTLSMSSTLIHRAIAQFVPRGVEISGFAFCPKHPLPSDPQGTTINRGEPFIWNNTDPVIYTLWFVFVTNESTYLLSDPIIPEETWSHTFTELGDFQCYSFERLWITSFVKVKLVGDLGGPVSYVPTFFAFDGKVDGNDLALFVQCYKGLAPLEAKYLGDLGGPVSYVPTFFAYDGKVDGNDLALFVASYKGLGP
jgi:hypothetical protein